MHQNVISGRNLTQKTTALGIGTPNPLDNQITTPVTTSVLQQNQNLTSAPSHGKSQSMSAVNNTGLKSGGKRLT